MSANSCLFLFTSFNLFLHAFLCKLNQVSSSLPGTSVWLCEYMKLKAEYQRMGKRKKICIKIMKYNKRRRPQKEWVNVMNETILFCIAFASQSNGTDRHARKTDVRLMNEQLHEWIFKTVKSFVFYLVSMFNRGWTGLDQIYFFSTQ